jgi:hypothetical protein
MPSSKSLAEVNAGAGKLHANTATAASDFQMSGGAESLLAASTAALNQEIAAPTDINVNLTLNDTSVVLDASLYGPFWLGYSGETVGDVFDIVNTSDDSRITDTVGNPIYITGITGASIGSGTFTSNVITFNLSGGIPLTGSYKFKFSKRATLNNFLTGAMATGRRFVPEPPIIESRFQAILSDVSVSWDSTPIISLRESALSGLEERYNRAGSVTGSPVLNGPGDGGLIRRTGQAVTVQGTASTYSYSNPQPDAYWAQFMVTAGPAAVGTSSLANRDGGTGFVGVLQQRTTTSTSQITAAQSLTLASRIDVIQRNVTAATIGSGDVKTKVSPSNSTDTALNPDGGATADDLRTVRLGTGDYFWEVASGDDLSEVAVGYDMVEVTLPGGETQAYVITELFGGPHSSSPVPGEDTRRALVRTLAGDSPTFPSGIATTGVTFRFVKTKQFAGVGTQALRSKIGSHADPILLGGFYHAIVPPLTNNPGVSGSDESHPGNVQFFALGQSPDRDFFNITNGFAALQWGGHDAAQHVQKIAGSLRGDGTVECSMVSRTGKVETVTATGTVSWNPALEGSILNIILNHASGNIAVAIDLVSDYINNTLRPGDELTVVIHNSPNAPDAGGGGGTATATFTWSPEFIFSGVDANPNPNNDLGGAITVHKYHGTMVVMSDSSTKCLMTLTTYLGAGA